MKLQELIIYINHDDRSNAQKFWEGHGLANKEININLCDFLQKLSRAVAIEAKDFDQFIIEINRLNENKDLKNIIINMVFNIADSIYHMLEADIQAAVIAIDNALKDSKPIQQYPLQTDKFIGLVNIYHLFSQKTHSGQFIHEGLFTRFYPGLNQFDFNSKIPFAINALILTGLLPKTNLNGVNTAIPLHPLSSYRFLSQEKLPSQRGIKRSSDYFLYKAVRKIYKGYPGNHTFLATNGIKALFIRDSSCVQSESVFASKIARCISTSHFASERLMDNQLVGSRALDSYAISVADPRIIDALYRHIKDDKKVLPGTGLIEEVCNFIEEGDPNIENLGLSSIDLEAPRTHLSKIDFDGCSISTETSKGRYDYNIISKERGSLYHANPLVRQDDRYLQEKFYARLKLSMLIQELFQGLADKSFAPSDVDIKRKVIGACVRRSDLALELFFENPYAKKFLNNNPRIVNQCLIEIGQYINDHFNEPDAALMRRALLKRVSYICTTLSMHLYGEELFEPTSLNLAHLSLAMAVKEEVHHYLIENTKPTTAIEFLKISAQIKQIQEKGVIVIWDLIKDKLARRIADAYSPLYTDQSDPGIIDFIHTGLEIDLGPLPSYQKALSESKGYRQYCSDLMRSSFRLFSEMAKGEIKPGFEGAATQFGFLNQ